MPVCQTLSKFLSKLWLNEKTWSHTGDQEKAKFLQVVNKLIIYKFFKECIKHQKKTNMVIVFSCRCIQNSLKYCNHRLNFPKIKRSRFTETQIGKFSWYIWKFRFTVLKNYHWSTMKNQKPLSDQSWLWNYLTNLRVKGISCSFSSGIKGKEDNVINVKHPVK